MILCDFISLNPAVAPPPPAPLFFHSSTLLLLNIVTMQFDSVPIRMAYIYLFLVVLSVCSTSSFRAHHIRASIAKLLRPAALTLPCRAVLQAMPVRSATLSQLRAPRNTVLFALYFLTSVSHFPILCLILS